MEAITVTPALRVPMVALVGNRALDDPGAFGVEHNDALSVRGSRVASRLDRHGPGGPRHDADRVPRRGGPAGVPAGGDLRGRRLPDPLPDDHASPHRRAACSSSSRAYNRGDLLLHPDNPITVAPQVNEDWVIEIRRQNDEATSRVVRRHRGGIRGLPPRLRPRSREPLVRGVHDRGRRHRPHGNGHPVPAGEGGDPQPAQAGQEGRPDPAALVPPVPLRAAGPGARGTRRRSGSSTGTTPSDRRSAPAWWPTRCGPRSTMPSTGRR